MDSLKWAETSGLLNPDDFNRIKFSPILPLHLVGVDRNILNFWRKEGLLPFVPKGQWARISNMQILWIWTLEAMRQLNMSITSMKNLTEYFITRAAADNLAKQNLEYHKERLEKKATLTPLTVEDLELLTIIKRDLADEGKLANHNMDVNYFSNLITESIVSGQEVGILIFPDYIVEYVGETGYRTFPRREVTYDDLNDPHVKIPLHNFLGRFILRSELSQFKKAMTFLSEDEKLVFSHLRKKNIRTITISKQNNNDNYRIDTTETGHITDIQAEEIKKILGLHNYESITLDTIDNQNLFFKRTKKHIKGF